MKLKNIGGLLILLVFTLNSARAQQAKGKLFIIGGGSRSDELIKDLVTTAGLKSTDYMVVLPMASEEPDTGFKYIDLQVKKHTQAKVRNFDFVKFGMSKKGWVDSLQNAKLIYILGGDQNRFMKSVLNTPIYQAIHQAYQKGATIAGTSAGAAVMSKYMITGKQLLTKDYKETFNQLLDKNIELAEGLGLLTNTIVDQHFIKRNRYNRLLSALALHPEMVMVGIDEGTAIVIEGKKARVTGDSQVLRMAKPEKLATTPTGLIKAENIQFGLFAHGDVFEIR